MSLAQLHYTSAPEGGSDAPGPRFTAVAPGVSHAVLKEVEALLAYEPPRDAPPHPSTAELAAFPRTLSHSLLSDGSRLLARSVCTGVDHTGRWCAFHTHAVVIPPGDGLPGGALPFAAWEDPQWADTAPLDGRIAPLAAFRPSPVAGGPLGTGALTAFATVRAGRLADFLAAVRELCEGRRAHTGGPAGRLSRLFLVERDSSDVARWLALASAALPRAYAERLTFTTYTRRPGPAPQQVVGVLPQDAAALTGRRAQDGGGSLIFDGTPGSGPAEGADPTDTTVTWAATAARIWLSGAPEVFESADALPDGRLSAGALACAALAGGVLLGPDARAEAAAWARMHARTLDAALVDRVVAALCAPAGEHTASEAGALARLLGALGMTAAAGTTAPLGALVLTLAVRMPSAVPELPVARLAALPAALKDRLADELAEELRAGVASGGAADVAGPPTLLRVAGVLGVDCADLLPGVAGKLAGALLADPEGAWGPAVEAVLDEQFELRTELLSALDDRAADDPVNAARLAATAPLELTGVQALPHLRMCAGAPWLPGPDGDRVGALNAALRASGVSPLAEPLVLRTAVRLVWGEGLPTAAEARRMLDGTGSDAHRVAGTWQVLVRAALEAPAADDQAPALAPDLLRCFPDTLRPGPRCALGLLEFAGALAAGRAPAPWVERALSLREAAERHEPVAPAVLERLASTLACRLLSEDRPDGELYALIHRGDPALLAAYAAMARTDRVRARLRSVPSYTADCFVAWTSLPGATRAWDETRTTLLEKVARPAVRALPAADLAALEQYLEGAGAHRAEEFRVWQRESALSRLGRRLGGLGRR
ncbi:GTPase-associated protein 1-related protein [Streptomyces sp. NBC_01497]|uniref:GTPase-associated protein 1-related protein n=1 Tax=Streptomyces sp. NBC_01497 TaxID=2903885 RepID=UPI002E2F8520|nr:GTPase-associated protein 1-related protein [Streptomyces sp. NBC_01497]